MAIHLDQISCSFGSTRALHHLSLDIAVGEQVALIGPSGCGKTTLLRLIGTQLRPNQGHLTVLDQNPALLDPGQLRKLRTRIAMIPQHLGLVPNVQVRRNVLNGGLGTIGLPRTLVQSILPSPSETQRAFHWLDRTGIGEKIYDRTDSLSGGQQQRVAVARALYQEPGILLADEPTSSVDPARARDMIELLTSLSREEGLTLVVSMHDLDLARACFPRLVGLRHGEVAFDQSPDELSEEACQSLYQLESSLPEHHHEQTD
ncbi:ATP-binding cassette domain-containing protein [Verrucomicrobiaceae bacterium N1E253]|uniref:ATP-binding cassette domain-containing protein n=1 Tax=Oceaniferula marina TaxID=2748318 RepID=A0A851GNS1_9BACT|nr:ATP-binding cassette domain-containing protein [Oceaniferula marina]NWK56775.1 ATP-binding cassette domain-containing protein [Oceaniferula marina]